MSSTTNSKNGLTAAVVILALALIGSLIWGFNKNSQATNLQEDNTEVKEAMEAMTSLRDDLAREVDSLAGEYDVLASENVELNGQLAGTREELTNAQSALSRAKKGAAAEINDLRAQIAALTAARSELSNSISALEDQNADLREQMGVLEINLAESKTENQQMKEMATNMEGQIRQLTYENFRATAFQVTPEVKRGNPTTNASRARRLAISFDVANVPAEFRGVRPVYLVITDEKGTPIPRTDYVRTSVTVNGQTQDIMAVEARDENIGESQRISFNHELENKMDAGYYRVSVFTDTGLLGSTNFRMR
jgi:cell division protein FtsB